MVTNQTSSLTREEKKMSRIWEKTAGDDTYVSGLEGSNIHVHETPFGVGSIVDQTIPSGSGRTVTTFNRFNEEVDRLLPPSFRKLP